MLKLPSNGSPLANGLLVAFGMLLGGVLAWNLRPVPEASAHASDSTARARRSENSLAEPADNQRGSTSKAPRAQPDGPATLAPANLAASILDPRERARLLRQSGATMARADLAQALREGMALARPQDQLDFLRGVFGEWAEVDPEAAVDYARRHFTPGQLQSETISLAVNKWGADNPHDAWIWVDQNLSGPLREQALTDLMIGWTRRSPGSAAEWLASTGLTSPSLTSATALTWAEQDPKSALAWTDRLPKSRAKTAARNAVALEWARQAPKDAAEALTPTLATEANGPELATILADVWGTVDPGATAAWIDSLPTGAVRDQAAGTLATVWAAHDIESALAWSETISDPAMREQVVAHLGTTIGALEPDRAIAWLQTLPPKLAADGITGALNSWAATDAVGLYQWLETAGTTDLADKARRSLGDVITQENMKEAMDIALTINSGEFRTETLTRYFRLWQRSDPFSAEEWLMYYGPSLDAEAQARLAAAQRQAPLPGG